MAVSDGVKDMIRSIRDTIDRMPTGNPEVVKSKVEAEIGYILAERTTPALIGLASKVIQEVADLTKYDNQPRDAHLQHGFTIDRAAALRAVDKLEEELSQRS